jgi:predicted translin family RNA/ssDNA-binding protein
MTDLFVKPKSKKQKLLDFIRWKHYAKTSDIMRWGIVNYSNRARTAAQELCQAGNIKRLSKDEKVFRFGNIREEVYEYVRG